MELLAKLFSQKTKKEKAQGTKESSANLSVHLSSSGHYFYTDTDETNKALHSVIQKTAKKYKIVKENPQS